MGIWDKAEPNQSEPKQSSGIWKDSPTEQTSGIWGKSEEPQRDYWSDVVDFVKGVPRGPVKGVKEFLEGFKEPEQSMTQLFTEYRNGKISQEQFVKKQREWSNKYDKPLFDVIQTGVDMAVASKIPPSVFNLGIAASAASRYAEGDDPGEIGEDIGKVAATRLAFKLGEKTVGNIYSGIKGEKLNPLTGSREQRIKIDPNKFDVKELLLKVRSNGVYTPKEGAMAQAIQERIRTNGIKSVLGKKFDIWLPLEKVIPTTPAGLLSDRAQRTQSKIDALERKVNISTAKSELDIANQLTNAGIRKGGDTSDLANILWNTPEAKIIKNLQLPNNAKGMLKANSKEIMKQAGSLKTITGSLQNAKASVERALINGTTLSSMLDGNPNPATLWLNREEAGPIVKNIEEPLFLATRRSIELKEQIQSELSQVVANAPKNYDTTIQKFEDKPYSWPQKINILAHAENASNRLILNRNGISEAAIAQMVNSLTDSDIEALNVIRAHFNQTLPSLIKPAAQAIKNEEVHLPTSQVGKMNRQQYMEYIKAIPTKPELSGYGAPRYYKAGQGQPVFQDTIQRELEDISTTAIKKGTAKAKISDGFLGHRGDKANYKLELDLFNNLNRHADAVSRYVAKGPTLHRAGKTLSKIENELTNQYGIEVTDMYRNWLNDQTVGAPATFGELDRKVDAMRMSAYAYTLTRNPIKIALMQLSSAPNAMRMVGVTNYQKAVEDIISNPSLVQEIMKESPIMRTRFAHLEQSEINEMITPSKGSVLAGLSKGSKAYVKAITKASDVIDKVTAHAAYLAARRIYMTTYPNASPTEAAIGAERVISVSQPMTQEFFRPEATRRNVIGKAALLYNTQRNQVYNRLVESRNNWKNGTIGYGDHLKDLFGHYVIPAVLLTMIQTSFTPESEKPEDISQASLQMAKTMVGSLPGLSQLQGSLEYDNGKLNIGSFAAISASEKYLMKAVNSDTSIEQTAYAIQSALALSGVNLQVPKNITAFVRSAMNDDPQWKRLIMSEHEAGYMSLEEEIKFLQRKMKKGLPETPSIKELMRDPIDDLTSYTEPFEKPRGETYYG